MTRVRIAPRTAMSMGCESGVASVSSFQIFTVLSASHVINRLGGPQNQRKAFNKTAPSRC